MSANATAACTRYVPGTGGPAPVCRVNPNGTIECGNFNACPTPVPTTSGITLAVVVLLLILIAAIALRSKP